LGGCGKRRKEKGKKERKKKEKRRFFQLRLGFETISFFGDIWDYCSHIP
jgi:hypothetical protein